MNKVIKFSNMIEYSLYLDKKLNDLKKTGEYNIFAHMICSSKFGLFDVTNTDEDQRIDEKLSSILKYGLKLSSYSSIFGTMRLLGSTNNVSPKEIINYDYYDQNNQTTILAAIPKYIIYNNQKVEFSTFDGVGFYNNDKLSELYKKNDLNPNFHHAKCCLFDAIKKFENLPKEYIFGVQKYNKITGEIYFMEIESHLSNMSDIERDDYYKQLESKILKQNGESKTLDVMDMIIKSYIEDQKWFDYLNDFEI